MGVAGSNVVVSLDAFRSSAEGADQGGVDVSLKSTDAMKLLENVRQSLGHSKNTRVNGLIDAVFDAIGEIESELQSSDITYGPSTLRSLEHIEHSIDAFEGIDYRVNKSEKSDPSVDDAYKAVSLLYGYLWTNYGPELSRVRDEEKTNVVRHPSSRGDTQPACAL